tara:strand:- start:6100 stop:7320 length:1221 start_codon:yes stop_codon:yes gene_type:complete
MSRGTLAVVQARLDDATARERMLNERMLKLEREFLNLKNPPSGATCLGVHLDDAELRRVSEEVIASIRDDMAVSEASSKRVGSKFIRDKILDSVGIHVKREVSDLWSKCVKQFNIPVTEKRDFNECDRRALDAWLTKKQEVIVSGEEAAAADYLLSLTQGSDSHEYEGTKLKETSDDEYRIVTGKDDIPKSFEDARKQGKNYFATTPVKKDRKKRTPWTLEEHQLFLTGLEQFGKGHWKQISRALVTTRSPQQVASHAQKFFKQQQASEVEDTSAYLPQSLKRPSTGSVTTPAKKTKPKIEDSANIPTRAFTFKPGFMVWARVGKSDWWPGTIQDVCEDGKYTVRYYQPFGRTTPPIPCKNIELYTESDEKHLKKRCSRRPHSNLFNETVANARRAFQKCSGRHSI